MNELQKKLKDMVTVCISEDIVSELLIDNKINEIKNLPFLSSLVQKEIDEVRATIKSEFSIKLDRGFFIKEKNHEKWFLSKKAQLEMKYWERYKKYLLVDKSFSKNVVNTMDDVLDILVDLLGDPSRNISYKRRGLIIGDVQSGKTANYTGLICKATDVGYKVIVLLTGTIEKLRQQTQKRIDEGFVGADSEAMMKMEESGQIIGVGKYDSSIIRPMVLTSTKDDFKAQNANNLGFDLRNINGPVIFVIKKNVSILKRLNKWLKTFNQNGEQPIEDSILVVDDEADNASINTKVDDSPTAINTQIRELLKIFTKSSYVGFTATPFANIFIDPTSYHDMVEEDLFPKDYIYSLNAPSNYIGARNIFGYNGNAKHMLVEINDNLKEHNSIEKILPINHKPSIKIKELPHDLKISIATFLIANVIEDLRGMQRNHRSMLVNVSRFTNVQEQISVLINEFLKELQSASKLYCRMSVELALQNKFLKLLNQAFNEVYNNIEFSWEMIQKELYNSCASIIVQTINQKSGKNFDYNNYKDGLRVIAVGGMSLSRGLTLEGLVISYFYRNSKMYDTLMQMGRWFGYRNKYDDLCKIWMSQESISWYSHITEATDELREEIKSYEDSGLTPMDFGLRVRSDITSLIVTAHNKMRNTERRECTISLSGVYIETPEIFSDFNKNKKNLENIKWFIKNLKSKGYSLESELAKENFKYGFKNVKKQDILDFIEELNVSPKNEHFNIKSICKFIRQYKGTELNSWDIFFAKGKSLNTIKLDENDKDFIFNYPKRSFSIENDGKIIKISGSKRRLGAATDALYGLSEIEYEKVKKRGFTNIPQKQYFINVNRNPLLIIYLIELEKCKNNVKDDEFLDKLKEENIKNPLVGFGIGIPTLLHQKTKYAKYVLNKVAIQQIFEGEMDWDEDGESEDD